MTSILNLRGGPKLGAGWCNAPRPVLRGSGSNGWMVEIVWHRRETRRQQRKQTSTCTTRRTRSTHHGLIKFTNLLSPISMRKFMAVFSPIRLIEVRISVFLLNLCLAEFHKDLRKLLKMSFQLYQYGSFLFKKDLMAVSTLFQNAIRKEI